MTGESFDTLPWHDAVILDMRIDRRRPGDADEVVLSVLWSNDKQTRIRFVGCYALDAQLNFGIVAAETVRLAIEQEQSEELRALREKWARVGVDLAAVKCFSIETNSTASAIKVYAQGWVQE